MRTIKALAVSVDYPTVFTKDHMIVDAQDYNNLSQRVTMP